MFKIDSSTVQTFPFLATLEDRLGGGKQSEGIGVLRQNFAQEQAIEMATVKLCLKQK